MERRPRSGRLATALGIALLPVVVLGVLTASNVVSLRALTQLTGITPLIEAVTELRLQAGTQV